MFYTGKKDRNGKMIMVGDRIRTCAYYDVDGTGVWFEYRVIWDTKLMAICCRREETKEIEMFYEFSCGRIEIVK